jgi:PilZ domain
MAYPAFNQPPQDDRQDDTVRLWLSERQWMSVLQRVELNERDDGYTDENQRQSPRLPAHEEARCMIRLGHPSSKHGTYLVKLRNISDTGVGFISAEPFEPKTRCTVALQDAQGQGLVCAASVVWSRQIDEGLEAVGIRFDQPINAERFHGQSSQDTPDPGTPA